MRVREQRQLNPVADAVLALTAVARPILLGTLYALKADVVAEVQGYPNVKLKMLPRLYKAGDGDCGICFEYAVHEGGPPANCFNCSAPNRQRCSRTQKP
jgi:hypothetical protein